jgi:hypothetical protein
MQTRHCPIVYLGVSHELKSLVQKAFDETTWDSVYGITPKFQAADLNHWESALPSQGSGLVLLELDVGDSATLAAMALAEARVRNPALQWVLVTDDQVDYFEVARAFKIGNVVKRGRFDSAMLRALTIRLMTGNIFGFGPYFPHGYEVGPLHRIYSGWVDTAEVIQETHDFFQEFTRAPEAGYFRMFIHELLTNTLSYAVEGITPEKRDQEGVTASARLYIPERRAIKVSLAVDQEKVGVAVLDSTGNLTLSRVLEKLRRQSRIGDEKMPPGMLDETGRGMSLVYRYSRFIVNILRGIRTESIFLQYHEAELNRYESIIVTEVSPLVFTLSS